MSESNRTPLSQVDRVVGNGIEAAVCAKHARRLRRLGWTRALSPPDREIWAAGDPPPRQGCSLEALIDGAQAFPAIAEAIENARDHVHITGWHIAPHFELVRGERSRGIGQLLAEAAERVDVRVLVWAGAPVPAFHPTRREVQDGVHELTRETRIRCETDPREHPFHCHHEKTMVVDGELAFVGGIDMTDFAGDRFDVSDHPARRRLGWHDVGTRLRGPAVIDVHDHFAMRWREVTGQTLERPAIPPAAGEQTVQVVRTVAEGMYDAVPHGEFRILESYVRAIERAERYIYLENQFLWSPEIVRLLADKLRRPPCDEFRLVVVLPSRANNGTRRHDGTARRAGGRRRRRRPTARLDDPLGLRPPRRPPVRARQGGDHRRPLADGRLGQPERALAAQRHRDERDHRRPRAGPDTRLRLWAEHLHLDRSAIADEDPYRTVDERWRPVAFEQLERMRAGDDPTHRLLALPGLSRRSRRLFGPLVGLLDDG